MGTEQDLNSMTRSGTTGSTAYTGAEYRDDANAGDIKREIDHTRNRMDRTIDALSAKLQPRNLVHEALGWAGYETERAPRPDQTANSFMQEVAMDLLHSFRGTAKDATVAGVKKAGWTAVGVARCHPLPAALIGTGLAWLAYEGSCSISNKAKQRGWKIYNPEPEYGGSYVDARTGQPYSQEDYGSEWRTEASAINSRRTAATVTRARTPEPQYGGSYVDARTGQPYNTSTYGQGANTTSDAGATETPGFGRTPTSAEMTSSIRSEDTSTAQGPGITGRARDAASSAAGYATGAVSSVTGTARGGVTRAGDAARSGASYVTGTARSAASTVGTGVSSATHAVGTGVGSATHAVRSGVSTAGHTVRTGASTAAHAVSSSASNAASYMTHSASNAAHQVRTGMDYSRDRLVHAVHEYPLAVGAAVLGAGLLVGLLLPRTRREEQLMGETAEQARRRAREAANEALERGRRAARETVNTVTREVRDQGLTPEGLKGSIRQFASHAADRLREDAEEAGLTMGAVKDKARSIAERARDTAKAEVTGSGGEENMETSENLPSEQMASDVQVSPDAQSQGGSEGQYRG